MRSKLSRRAVYAGVAVALITLVGGFGAATIYPNGAFAPYTHSIGSQANITDPHGVKIAGSYFTIGSYTAPVTPAVVVLCGGATYVCTAHAAENLPQDPTGSTSGDVMSGDFWAVSFVSFNATAGVPAGEEYLILIGYPGYACYDYQYIKTPTAASGDWTPTSFDSLTLPFDLNTCGPITSPIGMINVLVTDLGPY